MDASTSDAADSARVRKLDDLDRVAKRFGTSLAGALSRGSAEGKRLDTVLNAVGRTLLTVAARAVAKPIASGLTSLIRSAISGLTAASSGEAAAATPLARGGVVSRGQITPFAAGGVVAAPTYFPLGRGLGLMGEAGAEAVMPLARGADGRLGVRAGRGERPVQVTVNIATPDAESFRRSETQVAAALARAVARGQRGL